MRVYSALFLVAIALLAGACHRNTGAGVEINSNLKGYIPPKTNVLAGVNFEKLKQADFYKRHQGQLALPQLDQFSKQTGVDPRRDLASFVVAWDGVSAMAMVQGGFDPNAISQKFQSGGVPSEKYNKATLYGDGRRGDLVVLPKGILIAGPVELLKKSLDQNATGGGGISEDLQSQLTRINSNAQLWSATSGIISLKNMSVRSDMAMNLANILDYVDASAVGVTVASGLNLDAHFTCVSDEGSQRVNDALRGVIGLARLSTPDAQLDQLKIWDSIHVEKQGKEVHVSAVLDSNLAEKAFSVIGSMTRRF